jgi:hypothetical protein
MAVTGGRDEEKAAACSGNAVLTVCPGKTSKKKQRKEKRIDVRAGFADKRFC